MPNSAEQNIYDRLAAAPTFHPITADLFVDDWGLDAGDVVTVRSGENDYSVPIYSMSLDWRGSTKAQIHSTGNQTRKPLSALKRKQYYGRSSSRKYTDEQGVRIESDIRDIGNGLAVIVEKKDGKYTIKRASIVAAINEDDTSTVTIDADNINLTGYVTASQLDARLIDVDKLFVDTGYGGTIYVNSVRAGGLWGTTLHLSSGEESYTNYSEKVFYLGNQQQSMSFLGNGSTASFIVPNAITELQIVPPQAGSDTYTLQGKSFNSPSQWSDIGTFSRATSLSGAWSGSTYTVTATPQGETESTTIAASGDGWDYDTNLSRYYNTVRVKNDGGNVTRASVDILLPTITLSAGIFNAQHKATVHAYGPSYEGSTYSVATALEVDASGVYTDGQNNVNVSKGSWTTSGSGKKITFSPSAGTGSSASATITLDVGGWEWSDGYARAQNVIEVYDGSTSIGLQSYITLPTITASANSATYNNSTHKYSYTGSAKYGAHVLATSSYAETGTEAYTDGYTDGKDENEGVSALGLSSAYDTQPSADEDKGELTANKYYKVTAVPVSGTGKSFSFKTPAGGGGGGISTISLGSPSTTNPTADYDGGTVELDRYYKVTASPVSGADKTLKFKTPAGNAVTIDLNGGSAAAYPIRRSSKSGLLSALGTTESAAVEIFQRGSSSNNVEISNYWHGFRIDAGSSSKYYYFQNKTPAGGSHSLSCTSTAVRSSDGSGKSAGSISKSGLIARAYIAFVIACGGTEQRFYITVND